MKIKNWLFCIFSERRSKVGTLRERWKKKENTLSIKKKKENTLTTKKKVINQDLNHAIVQEKV